MHTSPSSLGLMLVLSSVCTCTSSEQPAPTRSEPLPPENRESKSAPIEAPIVTPAKPPEPPAIAGRREFEAGKLPDALELSARYALDHLHQDMNFYTTSRYDTNVRLAIGADGHAELSLAGTMTIGSAELSPSGASQSQPPREIELGEAWSGVARMLDGDLVIRFESTTAYRPPLAVDVEWVCSPKTLTAAEHGVDMSAWQCETSQRATQPSGPAHALVVYLQTPIVLASPRERLQVSAHARGGADDRSRLDGVTYSRSP